MWKYFLSLACLTRVILPRFLSHHGREERVFILLDGVLSVLGPALWRASSTSLKRLYASIILFGPDNCRVLFRSRLALNVLCGNRQGVFASNFRFFITLMVRDFWRIKSFVLARLQYIFQIDC